MASFYLRRVQPRGKYALFTYLFRLLYNTSSEVWLYAEYAMTCALFPNRQLSREIIDPWSTHRINTICSNPWFSRVWVLQEVASTQDVRVRLGVFETDLYTLHALLNIELDRLGTTSDLGPKDSIQVWDQACNVIFQSSFPPAWRFIFRHCFSSANLQLLELLQCLGFFEATEPGDKVFAIYHLASDIPLAFRPDYRASLGGVYAQFTRQIVKQTNNLTLLQFKQLELITPRSLESIPTWAPDYRTGFELGVPNWYHAAGTTKASYSAGSNPSILSPRGFDIAQVHFVLDLSHLSRSFAQFPAYYAGSD